MSFYQCYEVVINRVFSITRILLVLLILLISSDRTISVIAAEPDPFPLYPAIEENVNFWKKIYSQYSTWQGVIHDSDNVYIIYEVIELKRDGKGARRENGRLIRKTIKKYEDILNRLAKGHGPYSEDETRVAELFKGRPDPLSLLEAVDNIRFQRGQADRFKSGIIRSGRYLDRIRSIFREEGLPEDLSFLPHVESSFNYDAYSKFGAAGIWQFTYRTGKRYMTIDYTVDERRDPIISAHAAAKLLKDNYSKLGNWPLAVTAYNHGVNSMLRAQKEKGDYETIFNEYDGRRFKFASKNFYPEFLAARDVARYYETYFGTLEMEEPFPSEVVVMPGFAPVKKIAEHFQTDVNSIRYLNPALRRSVFDDQKYIPKGYKLRLPAKEKTKELATNLPEEIFEKEQKRSRFYYVRQGDVAGSIARTHGITLQELIWANNLDRRATVYVGQNLRIPTSEDSILLAAQNAEKVASNIDNSKNNVITNGGHQMPRLDTPEGEKTTISSNINLSVVSGNLTVRRVFEKDGKQFGVIRVDTGETLGHFAEWLEVSTQTIRSINRFRFGKMIEYNDQVIIPFYQVSREAFEEKRYEYHKEFEEDFLSAYNIDAVTTYEIKRGDNIWTLCQNKFELPFWLIRKFNPEVDLHRLKPMQKITVPIIVEKSE